MNTVIVVSFHCANKYYYFEGSKKDWISKFNNQTVAVGYFSAYDMKGNYIIITPTQCGTIEFQDSDL